MDKLQEYVDWYHTIPRSRWVVDDFLKFTKAHMDEQWLDIVIRRVGGHIGRRGANHAVSRLCKRGLLTTSDQRLQKWASVW